MSEFSELLQEQLGDPQFREEWDSLQPERELMSAMIKARTDAGITQKELAERTGIQQSNLSRIERGDYNPSWKLLNRIAAGMGKSVHIEFR